MKTYTQKEVEALVDKYEEDMAYYGRDSYYNVAEAKEDWKKENLKHIKN